MDNEFLSAGARRAAFVVEDFLLKYEMPQFETPGGSITSETLDRFPAMRAMCGGGVVTVRPHLSY